jgi:hypothetical protein
MSNFAERLVARSAGVVPGPNISVLVPRPVSCFEPVSGINTQTGTDPVGSDLPLVIFAEADFETSPAAQAERTIVETEIGSPAVRTYRKGDAAPQLSQEADAERPMPSVNLARASRYEEKIAGLGENAAPQAVSGNIGGEVLAEPSQSADRETSHIAPPPATLRQPVRADASALRSDERQRDRLVTAPMNSDRAGDIGAIQKGQGPTTSQIQAVIRDSERETPAAPVISIGKIEVQFLPQEPNPPLPRPQQQRTRGFDAYARARRGERR